MIYMHTHTHTYIYYVTLKQCYVSRPTVSIRTLDKVIHNMRTHTHTHTHTQCYISRTLDKVIHSMCAHTHTHTLQYTNMHVTGSYQNYDGSVI